MGFKLKRRNETSVSRRPEDRRSQNAFQRQGKEEIDSEEDSEEEDFAKSIQAKRQKINEQLQEVKGDRLEFDEPEVEDDKSKNKNQTGSKYIKKLLEAKKQRESDYIKQKSKLQDERVRALVKTNSDLEVFESAEYKLQKDQIHSEEEKEDNGTGSSFYANLLNRRGGSSNEEDPESINGEVLNTEAETASTGTKPIAGKVKKHFTEFQNPQTQLLNRLKELCETKITESNLKDYKKRYWQRRKQSESEYK